MNINRKVKILLLLIGLGVLVSIVTGYVMWNNAWEKKAEFAAAPIDKKSKPQEFTYYAVRGIVTGENGRLPLRRRGVAIYSSPRPLDSLTGLLPPNNYVEDDGTFRMCCNTAAPTYLSFCFDGYETVMNVKFTPQVRRVASISVNEIFKHVNIQKTIVMKERK